MIPGKRQLNSRWEQLSESINNLEMDISRTEFPHPTSEMCEFLIIAEDRRYSRHPGADPWALCRAIWKTFFCGSPQGGSTIAMQLVRTITGRYERTARRKFWEILLAIRLTQCIPKDRLPILYLWCAYYGWKMNNFKQACARLRINTESVDALDAAMLVARLKYPQPQKHDAVRLSRIHRRGLHLIALAEKKKKTNFSVSSSKTHEAI